MIAYAEWQFRPILSSGMLVILRWAIIVVLVVIGAALVGIPNFLIILAGFLLLGLMVRENEKAKKLRREKRFDSE